MRIQLSLNPVLLERAQAMMATQGFSSISEYVDNLIRLEWDKRQGGGGALQLTPNDRAAGRKVRSRQP